MSKSPTILTLFVVLLIVNGEVYRQQRQSPTSNYLSSNQYVQLDFHKKHANKENYPNKDIHFQKTNHQNTRIGSNNNYFGNYYKQGYMMNYGNFYDKNIPTMQQMSNGDSMNSEPYFMQNGHYFNNPDDINTMPMKMYFHAGYNEIILFKPWMTKSIGAFIGSWFAVFLFAIFSQTLKFITHHLPLSVVRRTEGKIYEKRTKRKILKRIFNIWHIIRSLLFVLQMAVNYLLMLIVMTFNVYLFLAVVLGIGIGHFIFSSDHLSFTDDDDH